MLGILRRVFSFTSWTTTHPNEPPPGDMLDASFDAQDQKISEIEALVADVRRSDGGLQNGVVTIDSLAPELRQQLRLKAAPRSGGSNGDELGWKTAEATAQVWSYASKDWAEHMPDTIPEDSVAVMDITGDHWSSRWWANRAAQIVSDTTLGSGVRPTSLYYFATAGQTAFPTTTPDTFGRSAHFNDLDTLHVSRSGGRLLPNDGFTAAGDVVTLAWPAGVGEPVVIDIWSYTDLTGVPPPPILTPQHFGAVGDGVTDDTVALQEWLDALCAAFDPVNIAGSRTGYAPGGRYLATTLTWSKPITIIGDGDTSTLFKQVAGYNDSFLKPRFAHGGTDYYAPQSAKPLGMIKGIRFMGGNQLAGLPNQHGLDLRAAAVNPVQGRLILENVTFDQFSGCGINSVSFPGWIDCYSVATRNNALDGISTNGGADFRFVLCTSGVNGRDGIRISGSTEFQFESFNSFANTGWGLNNFDSSFKWSKGMLDRNYGGGYLHDTRTAGRASVISKATFLDNSGAAPATTPDIRIATNNISDLMLDSSRFLPPQTGGVSSKNNIEFQHATTGGSVRAVNNTYHAGDILTANVTTHPARVYTPVENGRFIGRAPTWEVLYVNNAAASTTSGTGEIVLRTVTIPAGKLGPTSSLRITTFWQHTNNANVKSLQVRLGGPAGTAFVNMAAQGNLSTRDQRLIVNVNIAAQKGGSPSAAAYGPVTGGAVTAAVNTASAFDIVFAGTNSVGTDVVILENVLIEHLYGA